MWPLSASAGIDARPGSASADWSTANERSKTTARRVMRGRNARARGIRTSETSSRLTAGTIDSSSGEPGTSSRAIRALTIADAWRLVKPRRSRCQDLTACGETPAAFGRRCIPADGFAPPSNIPDILSRRALSSGRLAALGATLEFHHGPLARTILRAAVGLAAASGAWILTDPHRLMATRGD